MRDARTELPAPEDPVSRSRRLLATAERDRLEQVLRMLPRALAGCLVPRAASVLAEAACLLANARVAWVVSPDAAPVSVTAGPDAPWVDPDVHPEHWAVVGAALSGMPVHVPDVTARGALDWWARDASGVVCPEVTVEGRPVRSLSVLPVHGEREVRAALVLAHHRPGAFSERQLALVAAVADHLGHGLEMCEAVREQTKVSTALQETLLPPVLPAFDGAELAARYRPSGSGNLVGGDFYDVFGDGRSGLWLLLGDACGIGPEAAGLAGVARYTARALAETAEGPVEMAAHLNRALLRAAPDDRFCTAVLAHLRQPAAGMLEVSLASAGHPPPYLQRAGGEVVPALGATGLVLGILPDASIGQAELELRPGDTLVCYTDGVVEAQAEDGEQFGEARLAGVLADACGRSATGTVRRVERAVVDFRSPDGHDDLAVVAVRCTPSRRAPSWAHVG